MVDLLMQNGARPNYLYHGKTAWDSVLQNLGNQRKSIYLPGFEDVGCNVSSELLKIVQIFIENGAIVNEEIYKQISRAFEREFPAETKRLQDLMVAKGALKRENPSTLKEEARCTLNEENRSTMKEDNRSTLKEETPSTLKEETPSTLKGENRSKMTMPPLRPKRKRRSELKSYLLFRGSKAIQEIEPHNTPNLTKTYALRAGKSSR
jgi:hypothetical protein